MTSDDVWLFLFWISCRWSALEMWCIKGNDQVDIPHPRRSKCRGAWNKWTLHHGLPGGKMHRHKQCLMIFSESAPPPPPTTRKKKKREREREKDIVNQTNTGTQTTSGKLLRDGVELIWAFSSMQKPLWTGMNKTDSGLLNRSTKNCYSEANGKAWLPTCTLSLKNADLILQQCNFLLEKL